jgi:hypothetical protein
MRTQTIAIYNMVVGYSSIFAFEAFPHNANMLLSVTLFFFTCIANKKGNNLGNYSIEACMYQQ